MNTRDPVILRPFPKNKMKDLRGIIKPILRRYINPGEEERKKS